jgi:hypothetical protein
MMMSTLANAGTPLMWVGMFHLALGNLAIGVVEGLLLAAIARTPKTRAVALMVAANYFSAWLGWVAIPGFNALFDTWIEPEPPLLHLETRLAVVASATFLLSVLVELPFAFVALRSTTRSIGARAAANVGVQAITYAALAFLYARVSEASLLTEWTRVRDAAELSPPKGFTVYFIGPDNASLWSVPVGSGSPTNLDTGTIFPNPPGEDLAIAASQDERGLSLLLLNEPRPIPLVTGINGTLPEPPFDPDDWGDRVRFRAFPLQTGVRPLRWVGTPLRWSGIAAFDPGTHNQEVSIAYEVPTERWAGRSITVLPDGSVVFAFGQQICLLTPDRRIAPLAVGSAPIVIRGR